MIHRLNKFTLSVTFQLCRKTVHVIMLVINSESLHNCAACVRLMKRPLLSESGHCFEDNRALVETFWALRTPRKIACTCAKDARLVQAESVPS